MKTSDTSEHAATPGARREHALRLGSWAVLGVASLITLLGVVLVLGAFRNDQVIAENHGTATGQVEQVLFDRTLVRYETPDGVPHSPENGVLYPEGLTPGELVRIEYDTTDPELAKVAGRTWLLTLLPVGSTLLTTWLVAVPLLWFLRRRLRALSASAAGTSV
ncbi:DUF3592 domain-containing protein [Saccharomonospora sp.]|uniref:DUF3592 domain-containing protein n=1 Tax=Saccharomonospora sp. TaxID=33913 RepID=UPI0026059E68|nr:DUF3592 domain-containing protein [Saccharomonospora sp.]